jgi:hypothetical protein
MIRIIGRVGVVLAVLLANVVAAGTIYRWTDADGVQRYSNAHPPEGAENVTTIDEVQSDQTSQNQIRQEYDRMVEEASQEADRHFQEQTEMKAKARQAAQQQKQAKHTQQLEQKRQQLQKEIEAIQNRGLSPTFSPGQKEYLIKQIQDQIDQIDQQLKAASNL